MSKNSNNHKLELINSTFIPKYYNCLYSPDNNILIYSISSNIVIYYLSTDTKKIINNKNKSIISNIKYLDKEKNIILTINKGQLPIINILSLNNKINNTLIYSKIIPVEENFNVSNTFIDRFRYNLFLILLSGINKNILYFFHITNMANNQYSLIPIGKLQKIDIEIIDFKCFYNTNLLICSTRNSLLYYKINLENQACSLYKAVQFHISIKTKTLKIDRKNLLISIITSKGDCLIYDKEGNNITEIKCPLNNKEHFIFNIFSEFNNSLCLSTNNGNFFIYNIELPNYEDDFNFKIKKFIKYSNIVQIIKEKYELNKNIITNESDMDEYIPENKRNDIEIIYYNEKNYLIMIYNNSLISISLSDILNKNINKNSVILYQYNHREKINNGIIIYKALQNPYLNINISYDNIIYTCSNNNILNINYYSFPNNKFISQNFSFEKIITNNEVYITSIRFHPRFPKDILYAGNNKGFLYIINKRQNYHYQKFNLNDVNMNKNYMGDNAINLIQFSQTSDYIVYIGFSNGMQKLYDLTVDKNFNYYKLLSNDFFDKNEIQFRKSKSHILNFCYFFIYKNNLRNCFAYLANQKSIKISKFENENNLCISNSYNNDIINIKYDEQILDVKMHKSENYIITLNNKRQIILKEINYGNIVSILDFNKLMNYIYNFDIDISGLYLSLICDFKNNNKNSQIYNINSNKSSIAIIELTTGKIKNYIKDTNCPISKTKFDYFGRYIISLGDKGEMSMWKLNKEINNIIKKTVETLRENFYEFWNNFDMRNKDESNFGENNGEIMDEILTEELINKEKYILERDNYLNQEDFFRINNHGEKSILYEENTKSKIINNSSLLNNNSNINNESNNNETNININISMNASNDYSLEQDHYINRNKYNYKNSSNYIKDLNKKNKNKYNINDFKVEIEKTNTKKLKHKNEGKNSSTQISKSFRDMVINNKDIISRNKDTKNVKENELNHVETPKFDINQTGTLDKMDLRLFSFNSINEDDKDIFELKTKIIKQSSNLQYNQRRMINLNNAMNKIKTKNNALINNTLSNSKKIKQDENEKQNIIDKFREQQIKNDRYIKLFESNYEEENEKNNNFNKKKKKYPEPIDIDKNLININTDIFKNERNIVKIENRSNISNENLFFINNKMSSRVNNNNTSINSNSISMIKEIQNNNNSILGKNNSNLNLTNFNNNYNIQDLSYNNQNISVGEQISYLENNIKKFEKTFGK